jgi:GMP synthase-like glutamine amidotransferase
MRVLVIQNNGKSELGAIAEVTGPRGVDAVLNDAERGDATPASDRGFDGLIVLGGPMYAHEDESFPHLPETVRLIHQFHGVGKPIIGICLGGQLLARAFGKPVTRHGGHERGFRRLVTTPAAASDPLFAGSPSAVDLFQFHEDTFDIPEGATHLLAGNLPNQAFRVGATTWGFQCHFEITEDLWRSWHDVSRDYIARIDPGFPERMAEEIPRHLEGSRRFCHQVTHRWLDLVAARKRKAA